MMEDTMGSCSPDFPNTQTIIGYESSRYLRFSSAELITWHQVYVERGETKLWSWKWKYQRPAFCYIDRNVPLSKWRSFRKQFMLWMLMTTPKELKECIPKRIKTWTIPTDFSPFPQKIITWHQKTLNMAHKMQERFASFPKALKIQ